jgi:hypothetical protein
MKLITYISENHNHIRSLAVSLENCSLLDTDCLIKCLKKCSKLHNFSSNFASILLTVKVGDYFSWSDMNDCSANTNQLNVPPPQLLTWLESFGGFKTMFLWTRKRAVVNDLIVRKIQENNSDLNTIDVSGCNSDNNCSFVAVH